MSCSKMTDAINGINTSTAAAIAGLNSDTLLVPSISGSPNALPNQSIHSDLAALLALINTLPRSLSGLAVLAAANVFTNAPQTIDLNAADVPLITTTKTGIDDGTDWKLIIDLPTDAGARRVHIYSGVTPSHGSFVIVINARWHAPTARWRQFDQTTPSQALFFVNDIVRFAQHDATNVVNGNWAAWPTTQGGISLDTVSANHVVSAVDVTVGAPGAGGGVVTVQGDSGTVNAANGAITHLQALDITAGGVSSAGAGTIVATGQIHGGSLRSDAGLALAGAVTGATSIAASANVHGASITSDGPFNYSSPVHEVPELPLSLGASLWVSGGTEPPWRFYGTYWAIELATTAALVFPIQLPVGALLKEIDILNDQGSVVSFSTFTLKQRVNDWIGLTGTQSDVQGQDALATTSGAFKSSITLSGGGLSILDAVAYELHCVGQWAIGSSGTRVSAVRLLWDNPGPR
jgi:hypothetical protein